MSELESRHLHIGVLIEKKKVPSDEESEENFYQYKKRNSSCNPKLWSPTSQCTKHGPMDFVRSLSNQIRREMPINKHEKLKTFTGNSIWKDCRATKLKERMSVNQ